MFQVPAVVTMTIAATRIHRSLVCFTSGSSERCAIPSLRSFPAQFGDDYHRSRQENVRNSGVEFTSAKPADATVIPPNPLDMVVCSVFEQHLSPRIYDGSSINTDGQKHNGLSLDSDVDVERGE